MSEPASTVFRFTSEGVDLEFAGSEEFVERQLQRFRHLLESAAVPEAPRPAAAPPEVSGDAESLENFCATRPVREGRGAIQDRILLFIHYLQKVHGKREVAGDDILWCFQQMGIVRPKNLHNALGILKRKLRHLDEGSRRGLYQLSAAGREYLEGRFGRS
jgi:hypothetical protein